MEKVTVSNIEVIVEEIDKVIKELQIKIAPKVLAVKGEQTDELCFKEHQISFLVNANSALRAFLETTKMTTESYVKTMKEENIDIKEYNTQARHEIMEYHSLVDPIIGLKLMLGGILTDLL